MKQTNIMLSGLKHIRLLNRYFLLPSVMEKNNFPLIYFIFFVYSYRYIEERVDN